MSRHLTAEAVRKHLHGLVDDRGSRPAGSAQEAAALAYVRHALDVAGVVDVRTLRYAVPRTRHSALYLPTLIALMGNFIPLGGTGRLFGAMVSFEETRQLWRYFSGERALGARVGGMRSSSAHVARVRAASGSQRERLVILAGVDTPQTNLAFAPNLRQLIPFWGTAILFGAALNGAAQTVLAFRASRAARALQMGSALGLLASAGYTVRSERDRFSPGANDNTSGVAALLALAAHIRANPLQHVEVWFVFLGGSQTEGIHALLDGYDLRDAAFIHLSSVGYGRLAFATRHQGRSLLTAYEPDPGLVETAHLADRAHPVLGAEPRSLPTTDLTLALHRAGYRALTITGFDPVTDYPARWRQSNDTSEYLDPDTMVRAAKFIYALAGELDK